MRMITVKCFFCIFGKLKETDDRPAHHREDT